MLPEKTPERSAPSRAIRKAPGMSTMTPARFSEDMTSPFMVSLAWKTSRAMGGITGITIPLQPKTKRLGQ